MSSARRRLCLQALAAGGLGLTGLPIAAQGRRVLRVGPQHPIRTLNEAARLARDGDRIEVQAGDYVGDVASWGRSRLQVVAVGGRVRLLADGAHASGKGIFVVNGEDVLISGFDFFDARVPSLNGAGIRFETGSLTVRDCLFSRCEMGLLTNNDPNARLVLEGCEFSHGRRESTFSHLLYAGSIGSLLVSACYFHHTDRGHLLKSRAAQNQILYNRLTDEPGGTASYELEFANGGQALVMGNVIEQNAETDNPLMVSFAAEGYRWPRNQLQLVHNTWVNRRPGEQALLRVAPGAVELRVANNLIAGPGSLLNSSPGFEGDARSNAQVPLDQLSASEGYALPVRSPLRGTAQRLAPPLVPTHQYQHPRSLLALSAPAQHPGAVQT